MVMNTTSPTDDASVLSWSSQRSPAGLVAGPEAGQHAGQPAEREVEVAGPAGPLDGLGVGQGRVGVTGDGPHQRPGGPPEREVGDVDPLDRRDGLVDVAELAVGQRRQHDGLVLQRARRPVALDDLLGQVERLLAATEVHGHAGRALQRQAELAERLAQGDRLLGAALGVGLLAQPGPGPVERRRAPA